MNRNLQKENKGQLFNYPEKINSYWEPEYLPGHLLTKFMHQTGKNRKEIISFAGHGKNTIKILVRGTPNRANEVYLFTYDGPTNWYIRTEEYDNKMKKENKKC